MLPIYSPVSPISLPLSTPRVTHSNSSSLMQDTFNEELLCAGHKRCWGNNDEEASWASLVAQSEKTLQYRRPGFDPWFGKIPWRRKWLTHSSILAWKISWTQEPGGLQSWGGKESGTTERLTLALTLCAGHRGAAGTMVRKPLSPLGDYSLMEQRESQAGENQGEKKAYGWKLSLSGLWQHWEGAHCPLQPALLHLPFAEWPWTFSTVLSHL